MQAGFIMSDEKKKALEDLEAQQFDFYTTEVL